MKVEWPPHPTLTNTDRTISNEIHVPCSLPFPWKLDAVKMGGQLNWSPDTRLVFKGHIIPPGSTYLVFASVPRGHSIQEGSRSGTAITKITRFHLNWDFDDWRRVLFGIPHINEQIYQYRAWCCASLRFFFTQAIEGREAKKRRQSVSERGAPTKDRPSTHYHQIHQFTPIILRTSIDRLEGKSSSIRGVCGVHHHHILRHSFNFSFSS